LAVRYGHLTKGEANHMKNVLILTAITLAAMTLQIMWGVPPAQLAMMG
jgi:hypothetical protein